MIEDRIKKLRDELNERNKEIDILIGEASKQINQIRESITKFLDKETGTLGERIRTIFKEQGITIVSILTAIGMAIGVLVEALLGSPSVPTTTTSGSTSGGDGKGSGAREWIKNKLKALSRLLGKLADKALVIKATDPDATYTISNISLEFDTVTNASLASQIRTEYMESSILYDRILRTRIIPLNNSDTSFSVDINSLSKNLKGVLLIFTKERSATKFSHDTEEFFNPKITKAEISVEGSLNELYSQSMQYYHQYDEIVKHFAEGRLKEAGAIQKDLQLHNINITSYYTDKYALLLDFRTIDDNRLHGSGR